MDLLCLEYEVSIFVPVIFPCVKFLFHTTYCYCDLEIILFTIVLYNSCIELGILVFVDLLSAPILLIVYNCKGSLAA